MRPKGRNRPANAGLFGVKLTPLITEPEGFRGSVMRYSAALNQLSELVQTRRILHDASRHAISGLKQRSNVMDSSSFQKRFAFAANLIQEAGEIALGYFRRLDTLVVKSKGHQDMASQADLDTEIFIRDRLKSQFPEDAFLGEETGRTEIGETEGIWVVDPIDGTQPFIGGLGSWCVSIAYLADHILQMGFVYSPARKEMFAGGLQQHATLNGTPIRVSSATDLTGGIVGVGYSPRVKPDDFLQVFSKLLQRGGMFYREGSGALTLCYVASGSLIGYVEQHINSWDCLGAIAIIQAAGGKTNDFLADDGLWKGNRLIAGPEALYPTLESFFEC